MLALSGVNILTVRSSYGRDIFSGLKCRKTLWICLTPAVCSIILLVYTLPFAPVVILFVGTWCLLVRPLERWSHNCINPFRLPMFTTAPPLALLLTFIPCKMLTDLMLPDTFLCNWSKIDFVDPDEIHHAINKIRTLTTFSGDAPNADDHDDCVVSGIIFMGAIIVIGVPLVRFITKTRFTQWLLLRLVYRGWLNQAECLLALLHEEPLDKTARCLASAFFRSQHKPVLPKWIPGFCRGIIVSGAAQCDRAASAEDGCPTRRSSLASCWPCPTGGGSAAHHHRRRRRGDQRLRCSQWAPRGQRWSCSEAPS